MDFIAVPVPPPDKAPVNQIAETLGLLPGLRAERHGGNRCGNCREYQMPNAWLVWVPDGVQITDSAEAVIEQCRRIAYNGEASGWCLKCALKLGKNRLTAFEQKCQKSSQFKYDASFPQGDARRYGCRRPALWRVVVRRIFDWLHGE